MTDQLWLQDDPKAIKIISLNIQSLLKHFKDIIKDPTLMASDVLVFSETHMWTDSEWQLPGYKSYWASAGKGCGVVVYVKSSVRVFNHQTFNKGKKLQAVKVTLANMDVIGVYRSPTYRSFEDLSEMLEEVVCVGIPAMICGDFNLHIPSKEYNKILGQMSALGYKQWVTEPTHLMGNVLDHAYMHKNLTLQNGFLYHPYFTDHDGVCSIIQSRIRLRNWPGTMAHL